MSHPAEPESHTIRRYLEREFPGQVRHTWWDREAQASVFEVAHEGGRHHVLVDKGALRSCQDVGAGLRTSELADYMREARTQERRFRVVAEEGTLRIRSTPL